MLAGGVQAAERVRLEDGDGVGGVAVSGNDVVAGADADVSDVLGLGVALVGEISETVGACGVIQDDVSTRADTVSLGSVVLVTEEFCGIERKGAHGGHGPACTPKVQYTGIDNDRAGEGVAASDGKGASTVLHKVAAADDRTVEGCGGGLVDGERPRTEVDCASGDVAVVNTQVADGLAAVIQVQRGAGAHHHDGGVAYGAAASDLDGAFVDGEAAAGKEGVVTPEYERAKTALGDARAVDDIGINYERAVDVVLMDHQFAQGRGPGADKRSSGDGGSVRSDSGIHQDAAAADDEGRSRADRDGGDGGGGEGEAVDGVAIKVHRTGVGGRIDDVIEYTPAGDGVLRCGGGLNDAPTGNRSDAGGAVDGDGGPSERGGGRRGAGGSGARRGIIEGHRAADYAATECSQGERKRLSCARIEVHEDIAGVADRSARHALAGSRAGIAIEP